MMTAATVMLTDLALAQQLAYAPLGLKYENLLIEAESQAYGACTFNMHNQRIKFRAGKITPTKVGQFVTLWKRIGQGPILPPDMADPVDLFIISVRTAKRFGQFVFPKSVLCERGIVSKESKGGKRAMRVYPSWDITNNRQAQLSQAWQLRYFFEIDLNKHIDADNILSLFV